MTESYTFTQLFIEQLNDILSAEKQILEFMPQIIEVTSSGELREAFGRYAQAVKHHYEQIQEIFAEINLPRSDRVSIPVQGMIQDGSYILHHGGNSAVKDASLIALCQRLQHYKIAVYGTARTFARHLEYNRTMDMLQRALNSEGETDHELTKLAEGGMFTTGINEEACKSKMYI